MKIAVYCPASIALAAGKDRSGWHVVECDAAAIPAHLRTLLLDYTTDAKDSRYYTGPEADLYAKTGGYSSQTPLNTLAEPTPEAMLASLQSVLDLRAAKAAKEAASQEAAIAAALAVPLEDWVGPSHSGPAYSTLLLGGYSTDNTGNVHYRPVLYRQPKSLYLTDSQAVDPRVVARRREAEREALPPAVAEWERHYAAWKSGVDVYQSKQQAAVDRRQAQLAEAIARLGDESQRARWAEGVLPAREAVDLIVEEALAPLRAAGIEIVGKIPTAEIEHGESCAEEEEGSITTRTATLEKLTRKQYAALVRVREASPQGATVVVMSDTDTCDHCECRAHIDYVRACWMVGEVEVCADVLV